MTMTAFKPDLQEGGVSEVSPQNPLPIDDKGASSSITTQTGETVQLYYLNAGAVTTDAGQAAGVVCFGKTTYDNIKNNIGAFEASFGDTSLSFTSTAFTTEVGASTVGLENLRPLRLSTLIPIVGAKLSNGQYVVLYSYGLIIGKKADNSTTLTGTTYKYNASSTSSSSSAGIMTDDSAFTAGTSKVTPAGFLADETATDSVDEGDVGAARMTLDRKQIIAGSFKEDTAHTDADYGVHILAVRNDSNTALAGTDLDYIPLSTNAVGSLRIDQSQIRGQATAVNAGAADAGTQRTISASDDPAVTSLALIDDAVYADDAAFTPATSKVIGVGAVYDDTSTDTVDEGDIGAFRMTSDRKVYTMPQPDPVPFFDGDVNNTAQTIVQAPVRLFSIDVINPNSSPAYLQLFDAALASVTVGTTTPSYVLYVPASGSISKDFEGGAYFATAATMAATTTATGAGNPTTALVVSVMKK